MREKAAEDVSRLLDRPGLRQVVEVAELAQATESPPRQWVREQRPLDDRHVETDTGAAEHPRHWHRNPAPEEACREQFQYE